MNSRIRFRYFEFDAAKQRRYRHDGRVYEISPFALMWDDENYYMLGYDAAAEKLKHYRVDKMAGAVMDRFGKEVILTPDGEEHFTVSIEVAVSPQFYAWLFGFGTAVEILSPAGAAREMAARAKAVAEMYAKYA